MATSSKAFAQEIMDTCMKGDPLHRVGAVVNLCLAEGATTSKSTATAAPVPTTEEVKTKAPKSPKVPKKVEEESLGSF